ncbi:hypothetical protein HBB16_14905 [Pseudonocardia sp. MCCB 268]|nr:hypothetical protein [Pseudonocardia cytotoxica]
MTGARADRLRNSSARRLTDARSRRHAGRRRTRDGTDRAATARGSARPVVAIRRGRGGRMAERRGRARGPARAAGTARGRITAEAHPPPRARPADERPRPTPRVPVPPGSGAGAVDSVCSRLFNLSNT